MSNKVQVPGLLKVGHIFSFPSNNPRTSPFRTPGLGGKKSLLTACPLKLHNLKLVLRWFLSGLGQPEPRTRGQRETRITLPVAARDVKNLENQKRCPCGTTLLPSGAGTGPEVEHVSCSADGWGPLSRPPTTQPPSSHPLLADTSGPRLPGAGGVCDRPS